MSQPPAHLSKLAYVVSPFAVGLTTWGVSVLGNLVAAGEHMAHRPVYATFFYLTIALVALLGGRGPGLLTALLSVGATAWLSFAGSSLNAVMSRPSALILLTLIAIVGTLIAFSMDAVRRNFYLLAQSRADAARLQTIVDVAPIGIVMCEPSGKTSYVNPETERILGGPLPPGQDLGLARALSGEADVVRQEVFVDSPDGSRVWVETRATLIVDGKGDRLGGLSMLSDVTERRLAEDALRESEARFRALVQNSSDVVTIVDAEAQVLYKSPSEQAILGYDAAETIGQSVFQYIHEDDLPRVLEFFGQVASNPQTQPPPIEFRFQHKDGHFLLLETTASNLLHEPAVRGIVANSRDVTARHAAEAENARLLADAQAQAERESLLNRIHQTLRLSSNPDVVQARALSALGMALNADRCWLSLYNEDKSISRVPEDWHRDDLESLSGEFDMNAFGLDLVRLFRAGVSVVVNDVHLSPEWSAARASMDAIFIRALLLVPLFDRGKIIASIGVAMADEPRAWTQDDVDMAETVTSLMRTATDAARVQQREHRIAETLQDALLPTLPERVPGMDLDVYYRPALEEASIGGDFHDVFPLDKGLFALVVGDLSGKGLAAAAQVATIRNMLRYALYQSILQGQSVADAVTHLNRVVTEHELLTGFVTLFVGIYDATRAELCFVNCGQEPALLHRAASGAVEELPPTGPVVGMASGMTWTQSTVPLRVGDTFAAFTDGVSEAGRSRREFLGVEGVVALMQSAQAGTSAEFVLSHLVSGMEAHAQGNSHDDVCLLVAVMQ